MSTPNRPGAEATVAIKPSKPAERTNDEEPTLRLPRVERPLGGRPELSGEEPPERLSEEPPERLSEEPPERLSEETPTFPFPRVARRVVHPVVRPGEQAPTLALTTVELDAVVQGVVVATSAAGAELASRTVENVQIARVSAALAPSESPAISDARGPRRSRETLRADHVKGDLDATLPPSRTR